MVICSPQLGISPDSGLGGEVHDREILKHLADLGVDIEILLPKNKPFAPHPHFKITFAPLPFMFPPYIFNFFVFFYLWKISSRRKIDAVRVHNPYYVGIGALLFKKFRPSIKIVATYHHLENYFLYNFIDKLIIHRFDHLIAVSKFTKNEIIKRFDVSGKKISVVANGVDSDYFRPAPESKTLLQKHHLSGKKILFYLGVLAARKNLGFLLEVLKGLPKDLALLIGGEGPERRKIEIHAKKVKVDDRIIFLGHIKEAEKKGYLNLADVFLFPSRLEGFGIVVLEAMALQKAVLANNIAPFNEYITHGKNGFLLPLNPEIWQETILKIIHDPDLSSKIGNNARETVIKEFTWEKSAQKTLEIFQKVCRL